MTVKQLIFELQKMPDHEADVCCHGCGWIDDDLEVIDSVEPHTHFVQLQAERSESGYIPYTPELNHHDQRQ